ncbi:MAG TPA: hypothetical protein VJJ25_04345 [Nitrosopumilaceae archaeon]|nr:hypothetical protein [Nitrosopumilaceae archaeon]
MTSSRTITTPVNRKTADVFDAILDWPKKMMPDATKDDDGWWSFTTPSGHVKLKLNPNRQLGILDHQFVEESIKWDVIMRVVRSGDYAEIIITLFKPKQSSDQLFNQHMKEIEKLMENMKLIIEQT